MVLCDADCLGPRGGGVEGRILSRFRLPVRCACEHEGSPGDEFSTGFLGALLLDDLLRVGQVPPLPTVIGLVFPRRELMELREGDVALPLPPVEWEILLDAGGS